MKKILLIEGCERGFLSNYTTILTSLRHLIDKEGIDPENIFISSSMFSLYGNPSNWFDSSKIADQSSLDEYRYQMTTETINFDPWPTEEQLNLLPYVKYFSYNDRIKELLSGKDKQFKNCLGIHYRGTDHQMHVDRIPIEQYFKSIQEEFNCNSYDEVFICTDEENIINQFENFFNTELNFNNIFFNDVIRSKTSTALHFSNFNSSDRIKLGDDVLLDSYSLSKCSTIICKTSNLVNYARILNPKLKVLYLDSNLSYRG